MNGTLQDFRQELVGMLPRLRRFACSLAGSLDAADDLVQDTCQRALTRSEQFTPGTRFDSWLFAVMHSVWLNRIRSDKVRDGSGKVDADTLVDNDVVRRLEARVELSALDKCVALLPEEQRLVLMLVSVEQHSYKEAADILAIPIGTVMSRLARARTTIVERLASSRQRGMA